MSKTRIQLIYKVLDNLGVMVPNQSPAAETVSKVDDILDPTLAMLAAMEIVYVADAGTPSPPSDGEIDDAIFLPLADMIAQECSGGFNLAGDPALKTLAILAEEKLRVIGRPANTRALLTTPQELRRLPPGAGYTFSRFSSGQ
jgi:hypothetical protein